MIYFKHQKSIIASMILFLTLIIGSSSKADSLKSVPDAELSSSPKSVLAEESLTPYLESMKARLQKEWSLQKISKGISKGATVIFRVSRDGHYSLLRLDHSTGEALNDQAALETVKGAGSFAQLPDQLNSLDVLVGFPETGASITVKNMENKIANSPK